MNTSIISAGTVCLFSVVLSLPSAYAGSSSESTMPYTQHQEAVFIQIAEAQPNAEVSLLNRLRLSGSVEMSDADQASTRGESITGINELIKSRQLRYRILRNSANANTKSINSRFQ